MQAVNCYCLGEFSFGFFQTEDTRLLPELDMGNHVHGIQKVSCKVALVHRNFRSEEQLRKKILANWIGLGYNYPLTLSELESIEVHAGIQYKTYMELLLRNDSLLSARSEFSGDVVLNLNSFWADHTLQHPR